MEDTLTSHKTTLVTTLNRYRLLIEYDGAAFQGWQTQPNGPTVQQEVEKALGIALRTPTSIVGSGRTDSGVHARGQVAHFDAKKLDEAKLQKSLNGLLPLEIAVLALERTSNEFHARFDAIRRTYHYHVSTAPRALDASMRVVVRPAPDFELMNEAATKLVGMHNFNSFCIARSETKNRVCRVDRAEWIAEPRDGDWRFEIVADRYLHGMVRAIVGTLLQIGKGKRTSTAISDILSKQDRRVAGPAAPPNGLVLHRVDYPES